jgi:hypothetical protein
MSPPAAQCGTDVWRPFGGIARTKWFWHCIRDHQCAGFSSFGDKTEKGLRIRSFLVADFVLVALLILAPGLAFWLPSALY